VLRTAVASLALVVSCAVSAHVSAAPPVTCDGLWGPDTSEDALRGYFGRSQVRREMIHVGEGEFQDGSAIHPTRQRRLFSCFGRIRSVGEGHPACDSEIEAGKWSTMASALEPR
jgi:hypothetical protein